ncbi:hypothetical protein G2583_pO550119 (plasmid) [Escherichia coli O55:H7 str. CB9615]|nr:hypothetical protein G2583_pO550119 [Escherichia coli O55:H7 str. CB9615]EII78432.1 hypothetical protein EC32303_2414 [Escherichia coli 3.2303]EKI03401.1 hypothetical protein EC5905_5882 [Escherichia coli 5905]
MQQSPNPVKDVFLASSLLGQMMKTQIINRQVIWRTESNQL